MANILVVSDIHTGGEWIATQRLFSAVKEIFGNTIKLTIIGFNDEGKKIKDFNKIIILKHARTAPKPFSYAKKLLKDFLELRSEIKKELAKNKNINVIWCTYFLSALASLRIKKDIKIIYSFLGFRGFSLINIIKRFNYRDTLITILEIIALNSIDVLVTPSKEAKYLLEKRKIFKKKPIYILPNLVPSSFFVTTNKKKLIQLKEKLTESRNSKIIIYSGRLVNNKGIPQLINAFNIIRRNISVNLYLLLVYPKQSNEELFFKNKISKSFNNIKNGINKKRIIKIKNPKQGYLKKLYQISDVLVLASDIEMAPLSAIESLACGTPVISTKVGNMPDLISKIDKKLLLKNSKPEEIATKLEYFFNLKNKNLSEIKKRCVITAKNFGDKYSVEMFYKLIN